ncbi:MAG: PAS domain S-box protein [Roseiflexaceae bacterium]|nr:PAS domain S-box protein [Roseiflexaceae bacterium]
MTPMLRREANEALRRTLTRTVLLPLVLLALLALVLFWLITNLLASAAWVERSQQVLANAHELQATIIDQETGLRGFLLTGDVLFLEPYNQALATIDERFSTLTSLVVDLPDQQDRVAQIRVINEQWQQYALRAIELRRQDGDYVALAQSGEGKRRIDQMRALNRAFIQTEERLLAERSQTVQRVTQGVLAGSMLGALLLGGVLAYTTRRALGRLAQTYDNALRRAEQNEQELYTQREWFRGTLASIGDAVVATDTHGVVTFMNSVAESLTGWTTDQALGKPIDTIFTIVNEQTRAPAEVPVARVLRDQVVVGLANHTALVRRDGSSLPIDDSAAPVRDGQGALVGAVLVFRDISERYRDEQKLRESEQRYRGLVNALPISVWTNSPEGQITYRNRRWHDYTGITPNQVDAPDRPQIVHPDDAQQTYALWQEALRTGRGFDHEYRFRRADGVFRWHLGHAEPVLADDGTILDWIGLAIDIDDRKQAEQAIAFSEARYRGLAESMPLVVWTAQPNGDVTYFNQAWYAYTGDPEHTTLGWEWRDIIHPEDLSITIDRWNKALATGDAYEVQYRWRGADGQYRWFLGRGVPLHDQHGQVTQWVGTGTDIDDQKRFAQRLTISEARYRDLANAMPILLWTARGDGTIDYYNQRWLDYVGLSMEQVLRDGWANFVHPNDLAMVGERWQDAIANGTTLEVEFRLRRADGQYRWFFGRAVAIRNDQGQIVQWIGTNNDTDDQKQLAAAVEASEARYRDLAESMSMLVWTALPDGRVDYFNQHWFTYTGLDPNDSMSWNWGPAIHPADLAPMTERWTHSLRTGEPFQYEFRFTRHDGGYRWYITEALLKSDARGTPTKWYGSAIDIDARKRAEQELAESEAQFRQITEAMPQFVWTTQPDGYHTYFNQRWFDYTGTALEQVRGEGWSKLLHPEDYERTLEVWNHALQTGEPYDIEYRLREAATGEYNWFLGRAAAIHESDGRIVEWFGTCTDIDAQKRAERALIEQAESLARATTSLEERNRELDQFAYVTSHDLKAPLRGIANLSQWIEEDLGEHVTEEIRRQLELLRGRVHRMEGLIDGILQYSRIGRVRSTVEQVDLSQLLPDIVDLLAPPAQVVIEIAKDLPTLEAERVHIQQVFGNLIGNAIKHGGGPADLRIAVSSRDAGAAYEFAVSDNGPGIAPQYHEKVFVMFQTLSSRDKVEGTGLGLSLVKKIVELYGGRIWLESQEGAGATFRLLWPKRIRGERGK